MNKAMIRLEDISKTYLMGSIEVQALNNINVCINSGEFVSILGPSGSGKSTLMNIIGCLDEPTTGDYYLEKQIVSDLSRNALAKIRNHHIGFVFQSFNLLAYGNALDNVALPLVFRGISQKERNEKALCLLDQVGLADRAKHKPNELSGGQRQRVAIARALITDPKIILADEPTGNLDTQSGMDIIALFETLVDQGKTIIVVTHDLDVANHTQRVIRVRDGEVLT